MKNVKRWLALGMAAMMTAGVLAGCGSTSTDTASDSSESTATETTETAEAADAAESTEASEGEAATSTGAGSVYYLNFKPEQDEQWQDLAKAYTEETGVPVTVVTAAFRKL